MGVSFAIPTEVALDVSERLRERGFVTRGHIGVQTQPLTDKLARSFKTPDPRGVLVAAVDGLGPAARANLQAGDVILSYDGARVATVEELSRLVAKSVPGSTSTLQIWRSGKQEEVSVVVGEIAADKRVSSSSQRRADSNRLGLVLQDLPLAKRQKIGIDHGLLVEKAHGPANVSGLQPGDVITTNQIPLEPGPIRTASGRARKRSRSRTPRPPRTRCRLRCGKTPGLRPSMRRRPRLQVDAPASITENGRKSS